MRPTPSRCPATAGRDRLRAGQLRLRRPAPGPARHRSRDLAEPDRRFRRRNRRGQEHACSVWCRASTIRAPARVTLDGRDLREITKKSLRAQIAIVLQDTLLFSTTIRENIAYGRPDATEEEIREAARRAQADEFISRLPDGYDSPVGERGGHLSVGQRQRIGIARAFLKNAPILLLDEPTSALDPTTEAAIMETIKELMHGRTTLIVTHRLATIHGVDQNRRARAWPDCRRAARGAELVATRRRLCDTLRRRQLPVVPMSNVNSERRVEGDWWADPIPPNVQFGEGFYCETAQIFRFIAATTTPGAVRLGDHVSCYAGCSFSLGQERHAARSAISR